MPIRFFLCVQQKGARVNISLKRIFTLAPLFFHEVGFTDRYQYRIEPVHGERLQDPEVAAATEAFFAQQGIALDPLPLIVVGWQLQLRVEGIEVERREFVGDEAGYQDAHRVASHWMTEHGVQSSLQWVFHGAQNLRRMTWDEDYRREVGRKIS